MSTRCSIIYSEKSESHIWLDVIDDNIYGHIDFDDFYEANIKNGQMQITFTKGTEIKEHLPDGISIPIESLFEFEIDKSYGIAFGADKSCDFSKDLTKSYFDKHSKKK
jgi:hypothetical protein